DLLGGFRSRSSGTSAERPSTIISFVTPREPCTEKLGVEFVPGRGFPSLPPCGVTPGDKQRHREGDTVHVRQRIDLLLGDELSRSGIRRFKQRRFGGYAHGLCEVADFHLQVDQGTCRREQP